MAEDSTADTLSLEGRTALVTGSSRGWAPPPPAGWPGPGATSS